MPSSHLLERKHHVARCGWSSLSIFTDSLNAEDAGATEVKFMYDETEYGVESLWSPDMAQHQGW